MRTTSTFLRKRITSVSCGGIQRIILVILLNLCPLFASCTHMPKPDHIVHPSPVYLDWGRSPPDASDRARHDIKGELPFEWWYFDGHLDNGQTFVGVFFAPGFTNGQHGVTFSLYNADWSKESYGTALKSDEMRASEEDLDIKTPVGFVKRIDDKTYHVRWDMDDVIADFKMIEEAPGWMPWSYKGLKRSDVDFFWAVHQGRNRIKGTLTRKGITNEVTGVGYADHNWGRKPLNKIARRWVWGRILAGDYTIVYADVEYKDQSIISKPLYIAKGDRMIVGTGSPSIRQSDFTTHPVLKRHYPRKIRIDFETGAIHARIDIRQRSLIEEVDLLAFSNLNRFTQWVVRTFIARPSYFRVIADYDVTILTDGIEDKISGTCLYEVMNFE